jgi:photosystem II stability/assembly factor-like uncharacterized protein
VTLCRGLGIPAAFFLAIALASPCLAGINQWTTQGPSAGRIDQIHVDPFTPATIYAVLPYGGIFKTTNRGVGWRAVNRGILLPVSDLAIDPETPSVIYAGTYFGGGIFLSTDAAESWCEMGLAGFSVLSIAVDPLNSAIVYAGTGEAGIFKSVDGGASWSSADEGFSGTGVEAIVIATRDPDILYAASSAGVFRSTDAGSTWMAANEGITSRVNVIRVDPTEGSIVYAGTFDGGIFKTTDRGETWTAVNAGLTDLYIDGLAIDEENPSRLFAATGFGIQSGLFATTDGGHVWSRIETGFTGAGEAVAIDPSEPSALYVGMTLSAFRGAFIQSRDGGKTWVETSVGLSGGLIPAVATHPTLPQIAYAAAFQRAYRTDDGGLTWIPGGELPGANVLLTDPSNGKTVYLGTSGAGVWKSIDAAATWRPVNTGLGDPQIWALATDQRSKLIYAATNNGVFKSSNGGKTWNQTAPVGEFGVRTLAVDPMNPKILYAAVFNGGLYRTSDGGASWTPLGNLGVVGAIAIDPTDSARIYAVSNGDGVFRSEDAGSTWTNVSQGLPFLEFLFRLAIDPIHPDTLYVSLYGYVFRTTDRGDHWTDFTTGMAFGGGLQLFSLAVNASGETVYAGNYGGVFDYQIQPYGFYTVAPCRVVDTRTSVGALEAGSKRPFEVAGRCGVPPTAKSVALNITAAEATAQGHLTLYETGIPTPNTISIAYRPGQTRANNAIVGLDPLGRLTVRCNQPSGTVHFIVDVVGYFQ